MNRLVVIFLLLPAFVNAQSVEKNADSLLSAYESQGKFSGNVLIAKKGKVIFEKSYGYADVEKKIPNSSGTEFRVGSLTKMFTSAAILQLAEQKKLAIDDPVSKYIPDFAYGNEVKLVHLLSHTSGIKGSSTASSPYNLRSTIKSFKAEPADFTPGTKFEYNNFNYILLSYIAEKTSGKPLSELIRSQVLKKAGMQQSGIDTKDRVSVHKAKGYITNPATLQWEEANEGIVDEASGAGALYATARDLYLWSEAMDTNLVLPLRTIRTAWTPVQNNYGLGWMTTDAFGRKQIGHTGSIPGFIANFMKFPEEDLTIILLSNYQDVDGRKLSNNLAAVGLGEKFELPVKKIETSLGAEVLAQLTGQYKLPNGFSITVTTADNKLFAQAQGDPGKVELTPEGELKFFLKGPETAIEFIRENSEVKYMFVDIQGGQKLMKVSSE